METFTRAEDNQNNILPKVKEGNETDVERNIERKGSLWDSFHLSLDIATHILRIYLEKPTHNWKLRRHGSFCAKGLDKLLLLRR